VFLFLHDGAEPPRIVGVADLAAAHDAPSDLDFATFIAHLFGGSDGGVQQDCKTNKKQKKGSKQRKSKERVELREEEGVQQDND
jgi:hypothetical protein